MGTAGGGGAKSYIDVQMASMNMPVMDRSMLMQISIDTEHKAAGDISEAVMHLGLICQHF